MKKILCAALAAILAVTLCACAGAGGKQKIGLGVSVSTASSTPAGDEDGKMETDVTAVAVLLDSNGKILNCKIDQSAVSVPFDATGAVIEPEDSQFPSKMELGGNYGLKKASAIGKEWNEQVQAFEQYVVGKTLEEVKGIALTEKTAPADADLSSSVTISIGNFIGALEKAVQYSFDVDAGKEDQLGLNISSRVAEFQNAEGQENGSIETDSVITAVALGADGKITGTVIDEAQVALAITSGGEFADDVNAGHKTKLELWDEYGMKKASKIGKEWHEQIAAFCVYTVGKTPEEVGGIAVNEEGLATSPDLTGSVSIHIGNFIKDVQAAAKSAG